MRIDTEETSLKTESKPKSERVYRGGETDPVGKEVETAETKNRDATTSKLEEEMGAKLAEMGTYRSRATVRRTAKDI